jgi:alpha-glucosidase
MNGELSWWEEGVIYQVLVRSFLDTNGDGEGDLPGVIDRLDYLQWLGVRAIWLSPIYPSPLGDLGYDLTDFTAVHPDAGTLEDVDRLLEMAHSRGLKIILDWVANHTSDQHPWFQESRSSRDNHKRDWYLWRDPGPDGSPPNNWVSIFGGSAWAWDHTTDQYYCHTFLEGQPDLNWRHPEVQSALFDAMRFWLDRGIDGFRIDATCLLVADEQFRDNPPNPDFDPNTQLPDGALLAQYTRDQPDTHGVLRMMRQLVDTYDDRVLLGEIYLPVEKLVTYYGSDEGPELHLPINLQLSWEDWEADRLTAAIENYNNQLPDKGWPVWLISTHDSSRIATRAGDEGARVAAMLLMTLRGTPIVYYGEEIGMHDASISAEQAQDPQGQRTIRSRDPERTPMQWDHSPHAGFTAGESWLPVGSDYETVNVAALRDDPHSLLTLYRRLIMLRQDEPALVKGCYVPLPRQEPFMAYRRDSDDRQLLILLNLGPEPLTFNIAEQGGQGRLLLSTYLDREGEEVQEEVKFRGFEGVIIAL